MASLQSPIQPMSNMNWRHLFGCISLPFEQRRISLEINQGEGSLKLILEIHAALWLATGTWVEASTKSLIWHRDLSSIISLIDNIPCIQNEIDHNETALLFVRVDQRGR